MIGDWVVRANLLSTGEPVEWVIAGGRLAAAPAATGEEDALPGRYLLAGLVDAHLHLAFDNAGYGLPAGSQALIARNRAENLIAGVLLARDAGAPVGVRVGGDHAEGPEVLAAGRFLAPEGRYLAGMYEETSHDELVPVALAELAAGAGGWIKLAFDFPDHFEGDRSLPAATPSYSQHVVRKLCDAVHAAGGRIAAHVTGTGDPALAIAAGVDSVEHALEISADDLRALGQRGGAWTPTLTTFWPIWRCGPLPGEYRERLSEMLPLALEHGVTVLAGTDGQPAGTIADEIALLAEFGLDPPDALAAGSGAARAYLGRPACGPGMVANLVTYDDDPRCDLTVLRRPAAIIRNGVRVR